MMATIYRGQWAGLHLQRAVLYKSESHSNQDHVFIHVQNYAELEEPSAVRAEHNMLQNLPIIF